MTNDHEAATEELLELEEGFNSSLRFPIRCIAIAIIAFLVLALIGSFCHAAPPTAVITGPKRATVGELVILDSGESEGVAQRLWQVPGGVSQLQTTRGKLVFEAAAGPIRFQLICSNADGIAVAYFDFTGDGGGPAPLPPVPPAPPGPPVPPAPPGPPTPPTPPLPPSEFGLRDKVTAWAKAIPTANRVVEAKALAAALVTLKSRVDAGEFRVSSVTAYTLASAILAELVKVNASTLGASAAAWQSGLADKMAVDLKALFVAGRINTAAQWSALLGEIADGVNRSAVP